MTREYAKISEEIIEMLVEKGDSMDILEVCCKEFSKLGFSDGYELKNAVLDFLKSKSKIKFGEVTYGYYENLGLHWFSTNASDEWSLDDQKGLEWSSSI